MNLAASFMLSRATAIRLFCLVLMPDNLAPGNRKRKIGFQQGKADSKHPMGDVGASVG